MTRFRDVRVTTNPLRFFRTCLETLQNGKSKRFWMLNLVGNCCGTSFAGRAMTVLTINGLNIPMSSLQKPSQSSTGNILPSPGQSTPRPSTPYPSVILLSTSDLCIEAPHSKGGVMSGEPPSDAPAPLRIPAGALPPPHIPAGALPPL